MKKWHIFIRQVSSVCHGTEFLSFLGPKVWELVPSEIKQSENLEIIKRRIKKWIPSQCPCRLCQIYLPGVGFIWKYTTIIRLFLDLFLHFLFFCDFYPYYPLISSVNHYEVVVFLIFFICSKHILLYIICQQ